MKLDEEREERVERKIAGGRLWKVLIFVVLIVGAGYLLSQYLATEMHPDYLTPGKYQIALKYNVTMEQVFMDDKPRDCDFSAEPSGEKHCHFEQSLNVVRKCLTPDCPVERVYVSWRKVRD